jgi:predicted nucleic acid-binding protein
MEINNPHRPPPPASPQHYQPISGRSNYAVLGVQGTSSRLAPRPRGAHDLIITATARATDRVLVSIDAQAGFADLPEVKVRMLAP